MWLSPGPEKWLRLQTTAWEYGNVGKRFSNWTPFLNKETQLSYQKKAEEGTHPTVTLELMLICFLLNI